MPAFRPSAKGRLRPIGPIGAEIETLARDLGLEGGLKLHRLQTKWQGLFHEGPLSFHTWPGQLYEGRLTIYADSPPWLQQVSFLKKEILSKLQPFGISDINVRIGRTVHRRVMKADADPAPELSAQEQNVIEEVVSLLSDQELKGFVRRAMRAWARRKRRERIGL